MPDFGPNEEDLRTYHSASPDDERVNVTAMRMATLSNMGILELKRGQRWLLGLTAALILVVAILAMRAYA